MDTFCADHRQRALFDTPASIDSRRARPPVGAAAPDNAADQASHERRSLAVGLVALTYVGATFAFGVYAQSQESGELSTPLSLGILAFSLALGAGIRRMWTLLLPQVVCLGLIVVAMSTYVEHDAADAVIAAALLNVLETLAITIGLGARAAARRLGPRAHRDRL
jgi:hypothetical protein